MIIQISILPAQAARISQEASKTGAAVGVSQFGNSLSIDTGRGVFLINAGGADIPATPSSSQEN